MTSRTDRTKTNIIVTSDQRGESAYIYCGCAMNGIHRRVEAIDYVTKAQKMRSDDPDLHAKLGDLLMRLGLVKDAEVLVKGH